MTNAVTTFNCDEGLLKFAKEVDFTELFSYIQKFTDVKCDFQRPEITINRGSVHIDFMSDNIVSQTGAFASILDNCCFMSFGNGVVCDNDTNEISYWVSVSIRYRHKDGGSNGMDVCQARYSNGVWAFWNAGQR
jgi:hypothetical protein